MTCLRLMLVPAVILLGFTSCSSSDGTTTDGEANTSIVETDTPSEGGAEMTGDDAENPAVFGYEVDGPEGTTAVVVSTLVAQGEEQPPTTATWSITDEPRSQLYTNWVESGELEVEVTEGGPATIRIIQARYVDPDDPFAGIEELDELSTIEVDPGATETIGFP